MPESYTGLEGADAAAAGLATMDGTESRKLGYRAINKTRDMIIWALNQAKAYTDTKFGAISLTWAAITGKPATFPASAHTHNAINSGSYRLGINGAEWNTPQALYVGGYLNVAGNIYTPNSSIATTSYTVAYIDSAGRLCRGASSIRYKDHLSDPELETLGDIFPQLREYAMKGGDGKAILGHFAEDLAANPDTARFVVYVEGADGEPMIESIDFLSLLMTQTAVLNALDQVRAAEIRALEARIANLEGN